MLKYKTWLYEVALEAGTTAVHDNMPPEKMPPNVRRIKERIKRLTDDMEQRYLDAAKEPAAAEEAETVEKTVPLPRVVGY